METFLASNSAFEAWLHDQCNVYEPDLEYKHKRMKRDAFTFLRATYFRWAQGIEDICPELKDTPAVLTAADVHLENFGTWRNREGRLVWGINDLDEAAAVPFAYDLVRLATSALLAKDAKDAGKSGLAPFVKLSSDDTADMLLAGYKEGLKKPRPTLLDEQETWLRPYAASSDDQRAKFWDKIQKLGTAVPEEAVIAGFRASFPEGASIIKTARWPKKGAGSLGRPRFAAVAELSSERLVREAKALVPSAWDWAHDREHATSRFEELCKGPNRSPDPSLQIIGGYIFRRLAPDACKAGLAGDENTGAPASDEANALKLLHAMGFDLGTIHAGSGRQAAITEQLDQRDPSWLQAAARTAAGWVNADYEDWCKLA